MRPLTLFLTILEMVYNFKLFVLPAGELKCSLVHSRAPTDGWQTGTRNQQKPQDNILDVTTRVWSYVSHLSTSVIRGTYFEIKPITLALWTVAGARNKPNFDSRVRNNRVNLPLSTTGLRRAG